MPLRAVTTTELLRMMRSFPSRRASSGGLALLYSHAPIGPPQRQGDVPATVLSLAPGWVPRKIHYRANSARGDRR